MQIILLSGGSGQRLWPLSNDTRSKQFLRLLPGADGHAESMLQRIVRQISESDLHASITVATGVAQRDGITNQLGRDAAIVTEPSRRETFPAIALASAYLAMERGIDPDEVVAVMPCDTFTVPDYYEAVGRMARAVEDEMADMALMGVSPSFASGEFGYILADAGNPARVKRFCEKPVRTEAQALIEEGALWNAGVFVFRLRYILDIISKYIKADSYAAFEARYDELPAVSFDREVVEKATSLAVVKFVGMWKDLGTWDALAREMKSSCMGNALSEATENTTAINELNIPLVCYGIKNVVVAVSPDGILVADKDHSGDIKPIIDSIHARPMYEERRWGDYAVLDNRRYPDGFGALTKRLTLNPGCSISYQRHNHRAEIWTFVDGEGLIVLDGETRPVRRGDVINISCGQLHALRATTSLTFIEVQMGSDLVEEDIERFEWQWD